MALEILFFAISIAAVVSAISFISKYLSTITFKVGIPEYLTCTIVISFVLALPALIIVFFSNIYEFPDLGFMTIIGASIAMISLMIGIFLLKNEVSLQHERYRNATFMWAAALLLLIVSFDNFIDRMDAIFLLSLFAFYCLYVFYRTKTSKEYVFLKTGRINKMLVPVALLGIVVASLAIVGTAIMINTNYAFSVSYLGLFIIGFFIALPSIEVTRTVFKSPIFTFDSFMGNIVVMLTLVPGLAAIYLPMPYDVSGTFGLMPLLVLNILALSFAMTTRFREKIGKQTGILFIAAYFAAMFFLLV